ncbi:MAG TPA: hypothetical protein DEQ42_15445 [Shigella sp.]|nr:hypothetical protein [Shigella sp.]
MGALAINPAIDRPDYLNLYTKSFGKDLGSSQKSGHYNPRANNHYSNEYVQEILLKKLNISRDDSSRANNHYSNEYAHNIFVKKLNLFRVFANKNHTYNIVTFTSLSGLSEHFGKTLEVELQSRSECVYSLSDMLTTIKRVFGLSTTNVASIVGVSRATIYNHISSGSAELNEYENLFYLAKKVEEKGWDISRGLKSVMIDGKTLLKYLSSKPLDEEKVLRVCEAISKKLESISVAETPSVFEEKLAAIISVK